MTHAEWLQLKATRDANGQCLCCGRPERITETMCSNCRVSMINSVKRRRAARAASGLCIDCPGSAVVSATKGTLRCDKHRTVASSAQRHRVQRRKERASA